MRLKPIFLILNTSLVFLISTGCNSGPSGPEPGTPAFAWASAKQSFASGDFLKTNENLDRAMKSADYALKAIPWSLVMNGGLVRGYSELADDYEQGARVNRSNPAPFRKQTSNYRRFARGLTLQLAEQLRDFKKGTDDPVTLAFPFPSGSQTTPPLLGKVMQGIFPPPAELEDAEKALLTRDVILQTAAVTGSGEDSSKAQEMFKAGDVKIPRATFLAGMGRALADAAELYGPKKLDEPDRAKMFAESAREAMKGAPAGKDTKALNDRLDKILKKKAT